jgi:hypothetical protein
VIGMQTTVVLTTGALDLKELLLTNAEDGEHPLDFLLPIHVRLFTIVHYSTFSISR